MKFLIAGLGNAGDEYAYTRHNIGFEVANQLARSLSADTQKLFTSDKHAYVNRSRFRGKHVVIIMPTTYMNLSGKAVNYWLQAEKIPLENLLVISDDLALPFGTLRMKKKGSDGGHNGLSDIATTLNTVEYPRLRFGIGSNFPRGQQSNYVLSRWTIEEQAALPELIDRAVEMTKSFMAVGIDRTMTLFN